MEFLTKWMDHQSSTKKRPEALFYLKFFDIVWTGIWITLFLTFTNEYLNQSSLLFMIRMQ